MTQRVNIVPLNLVGEGDRGVTYDFVIRETSEFVLMKRLAGTMNGNAYHEGISNRVNPKTFIILEGEIEFLYRAINEENHHSELIDYPCIIQVYPYVTHAMRVIKNAIFLEALGFKDVENDRHFLEVINKAAVES
jgi:hypothetical protein